MSLMMKYKEADKRNVKIANVETKQFTWEALLEVMEPICV